MRHVKMIVDWLSWLAIVAGVAAMVYFARDWGNPNGPLAPRKWDGKYHSPGPIERPKLWQDRKLEGIRESTAAPGSPGMPPSSP